MTKRFLLFVALLTATVMNLHAAVPAGMGDFSVTFTTLDAQTCKLPITDDVNNNDTVFIIGNFGSHPWQVEDGDDYMEFIGNADNSDWLMTTFSYPADFQFQFLIRYENPDYSYTDVVVPSTPITFDGTTFSYQFTLCESSAQITANFDMQGHGEQVEPQTIASGSKFVKPEDPTAKGYEFRNWYTDAQSLGNAFDFSKAVTADKDTTITLYAKWRDSVAWEQFQDSLDKYSYVEYDSTYEAGFIIHLATTQDAQVQPLKDAAFIEASEDVLANYDFRTLTTTIVSLYPALNGELGRCMGEESPESPIRRRPRENYFLKLISAYTQLPYRANGLNAVRGLYTSYVDLLYKAWLETNYENDADICKCILDSEVFFKGSTKLKEAFDVCEK